MSTGASTKQGREAFICAILSASSSVFARKLRFISANVLPFRYV